MSIKNAANATVNSRKENRMTKIRDVADCFLQIRNDLRDQCNFTYFAVSGDGIDKLNEVACFIGDYDFSRKYDPLREGEKLYFIIRGSELNQVNRIPIGNGYREIDFDSLVDIIRNLK